MKNTKNNPKSKLIAATIATAVLALSCAKDDTQQKEIKVLNKKETSVAYIASFTAKGDQGNLKLAINEGLDNGLTINEIKEILTQLYAYCGFPRSLNALSTFMTALKERKANGITDEEGALPGKMPAGKSIDFGTANQTKLTGSEVKGALFDFAPAIDEYLKAHLFGDIFARDNLDWKTRELATIAALASMQGVESQRDAHIGIGKHNGITDEQIADILVIAQNNVKQSRPSKDWSPIPLGDENTAYAKYFIGKSYLAPLSKDQVNVSGVTFEPACRNNWHVHEASSGGGQILICTAGVGYYQEWGKPARKLTVGDTVNIPAGVKHWHGAAPDSWFQHIAISVPGDGLGNTWLEPVSDDDYAKATR